MKMGKKIKETMKGMKKIAYKKEVGEKRIRKINVERSNAFAEGKTQTAKGYRKHEVMAHKKVQEELNRGKRREQRLKEGKKV
jgi:hypothetical protein